MKFDAGMCIEVIEHLTPAMLEQMFRGVAHVSKPDSCYLLNSGQPEFVKKENFAYLEPFLDGHVISWSIDGLRYVLEPLGFCVRSIKGKSWACLVEYGAHSTDEVVDRCWHILDENKNVLCDREMGDAMFLLGLESIRSYAVAADLEYISAKNIELEKVIKERRK